VCGKMVEGGYGRVILGGSLREFREKGKDFVEKGSTGAHRFVVSWPCGVVFWETEVAKQRQKGMVRVDVRKRGGVGPNRRAVKKGGYASDIY
jgi:hypothetical protein